MLLTILAGAVSAHVVAGEGLAGTVPLWGFCVLTVVAAAPDRGELLRQFLFAH